MTPSLVKEKLRQLDALVDCGYSLAIRVRFGRPILTRWTYPLAWVQEYHRHNLSFCDPEVIWALTHTGARRWSEGHLPDPFSVHERARVHGLNFGVTLSVGHALSRTMAGLAHRSRDYTDDEITKATQLLEHIHIAYGRGGLLSEAHIRALSYYEAGLDRAEICRRMGLTPNQLKACLAGARKRLGARSNEEALGIAMDKNMIWQGVSAEQEHEP